MRYFVALSRPLYMDGSIWLELVDGVEMFSPDLLGKVDGEVVTIQQFCGYTPEEALDLYLTDYITPKTLAQVCYVKVNLMMRNDKYRLGPDRQLLPCKENKDE